MEFKDSERMVIAKPIPSRPCSSFRSFSELLAGAINASPPCSSYSETVVAAIRPKTVRFKPVASRALGSGVASSQGEVSEAAACNSSNKTLEQSCKPTVVYKPLAKVVSRTTASVLANQGNFDIIHQKAIALGQTQFQHVDQAKHKLVTNLSSDPSPRLQSQLETSHASESKMTSQYLEDNQKGIDLTVSGDRPSYDGYNWRKYGQKQVKGSEYPRSYYKCTHPNCPVKKKVERSLDGQIAEIVYKGEHNHSKPQPPKRPSSGTQDQGFMSDGTDQDISNPLWSNTLNELNEGSEGCIGNHNEVGRSRNPTYPDKGLNPYDAAATDAFNSVIGTPDNSCGLSGDIDDGNRAADVDVAEPKSKRRKVEHQSDDQSVLGESVREPRVVVQNSTDSDMIGDGFRWRKYGQKVVKGNPYPRSYYRCTSLKCNVRKHVERALDDPTAFITKYEGKHNHDMPVTRNLNPVGSDPDSPAPGNKSKKK